MMNKPSVLRAIPRAAQFAAALAVSGLLAVAAPAQAHGDARWSVTVGSPGYSGYVVPPQGVVVYPQSQYVYGEPPSAFAPPPNVVYVAPQPLYQTAPPATLYADPYFYGNVQRPYYEGHGGHHGYGQERGHGSGHDGGHREWRDHDSHEPRASRR